VPALQRAYSLVTVKDFDPAKRTFSGLATSPEPDRIGDVIESTGVSFKNPLALLLYHDPKRPVGQATFGRPTEDGTPFRALISTIDRDSGVVKERLDEAVDSLAAKPPLIRGVSIGFRPLEEPTFNKATGGLRFSKVEVLELSMVVIPAHQDATIAVVKSLDAPYLAASGTGTNVDFPPAGVSASPQTVKARKDARSMKTITEQITAFEATRQAKSARMTELMAAAGDKGETLDEEQSQEYDDLETEIKKIDAHLTRLAALEEANKKAAVPVNGSDPKKASETRGGSVISVKSNLPPGTGFTRYAMALAASRGSRLEAAEYAKRWEKDTPEVAMVLKAAVTAGTTTDSDWAAPLVVYNNLANEFVELLRPQTILGKIPGIRRVPFNVTMPTQTQGASANWVGQTKPKPVSELKFGQLSLGMFKAAGIVVLSEELVRSSSPSAEAIVRQDLINTIAQFLDEQFIDPANAGSANVSPAAITNGITPVDSTGTTAAAFRTDVKTLLATFTAANLSLAGSVWIMTETQALAFSMIQNALGQPEYPGITAQGGTLMGLPVITSESVNAEGGSPAGNRIVLLKANEILLADDGGVTVDVSREATVQMNSTPDDPATASTVLMSFWQNNLVGLRAERYINWLRRRAEAVGIIEGAIYVG
jgi:HK97 family phage major capsid protein